MDTNNGFWQSNSTRGLLTALIALLVAFTAVKLVSELKAVSRAGEAPTNTITVSGKGEVMATPDIATFSFTVSEEAPIVSDAQSKMDQKMKDILGYVSKSGVEDKDVKTVSYNIYPRYEWQGANTYGGGKQILAAYVVSQTVQVKVRDLAKAGSLLSGIGEYGATDVSGLSFTLDKQDDIARQARDKAIADARDQAKVLAKSLGVSLGDIVNFSESSGGYPVPMYYMKDSAMGMGGAVRNEAAQIPTGENTVTSNVVITYEIK
jgi:uncharacterized protein YggE